MDIKRARPLVSVIMPAYNSERFIAEAINSVISQTVTDWELIVIDDGSTDKTRAIVSAIAESDERIRLVANEKNMGVAKSRNVGLDLFKGQFLALLDSDDYWECDMLEKTIFCAEESGADIVYCSYALVDESGKKLCNDFIVPLQTTFKETIVRLVMTCSSVLMTSDLARRYRFPTDVYHEDVALWFRIMKDGAVARGVPEVLSSYRQNENSRSSNKIKNAFERWPIYRKHLKMSVPETIVTMIRYGYYGFLKFRRV